MDYALKVKSGVVACGVQGGAERPGRSPWQEWGPVAAVMTAAAQRASGAHTACWGPGKDLNSQLQVWFLLNVYCFRTIVKSGACLYNGWSLKEWYRVKEK